MVRGLTWDLGQLSSPSETRSNLTSGLFSFCQDRGSMVQLSLGSIRRKLMVCWARSRKVMAGRGSLGTAPAPQTEAALCRAPAPCAPCTLAAPKPARGRALPGLWERRREGGRLILAGC